MKYLVFIIVFAIIFALVKPVIRKLFDRWIKCGRWFAITEAERNAKKKYRDKGKQMNIDFYPSEADPIEYIEKLAYKQGYIKALLRADMEQRK